MTLQVHVNDTFGFADVQSNGLSWRFWTRSDRDEPHAGRSQTGGNVLSAYSKWLGAGATETVGLLMMHLMFWAS